MELDGVSQMLQVARNAASPRAHPLIVDLASFRRNVTGSSLFSPSTSNTPWTAQPAARHYTAVADVSAPRPPDPADARFADELAEACAQAGQEMYGAGSFLVGGGSDSADAEDIAFLAAPSIGDVEQVWVAVLGCLQIDPSRLSKPVMIDVGHPGDHFAPPKGTRLRALIGHLEHLTAIEAASLDETRFVRVVVGRLASGWWAGLAGIMVA